MRGPCEAASALTCNAVALQQQPAHAVLLAQVHLACASRSLRARQEGRAGRPRVHPGLLLVQDCPLRGKGRGDSGLQRANVRHPHSGVGWIPQVCVVVIAEDE
jgi:hypothetical protein